MADQRALLADAASRAADYLDGLEARAVTPEPEAVEALQHALSGPLPDGPSDAAKVLAFLDFHG